MCGGNMKRCELCQKKARILCESDQASLCWDCDAKVHSANFLVARHSRKLLCHVCRSPTPWSASGAKLIPTFSVCGRCVDERRGGGSDEEEVEADGGEKEKIEENQVVPWSPPPAPESSSSNEESVSGGEVVASRKRCRTDEDLSCSSSKLHIRSPETSVSAAIEAASVTESFLSQLQKIQRTDSGRVDECGSGISDSRRRFHREERDSGGQVTECRTMAGPSM